MTSSSLSFARKILLLATGLALAGCGCSPSESDDPVAAAEAGSRAFRSGRYAAAVTHCRRSLELAPENIDVLVLLGRAAMKAGDLDAARQAADEAMRLRPKDVGVIQLAAQVAMTRGEYAKAFKAYSDLTIADELKTRPDLQAIGWTGRGIVNLARTRAGAGGDECRYQAHTDLLQAICLDPSGAKSAYYHLGLLYAEVFRYKQAAVDSLREYASRMQDESEAHVIAARQRIERLEKEIKAEAESRPGYSRRNSSAATAACGDAEKAEEKRQYKAALGFYEAAFKHDSTCFVAAAGAGRLALQLDGKTRAGQQKAYDYYRAAAALRASPDVLITVGNLALKLGKKATAVEYYRRAVASAPRNLTAINGLVHALSTFDDKLKAKEASAYKFYGEILLMRK